MSLNKIGKKYVNKLHWEYVMEYCCDIDFILDYMPEELRFCDYRFTRIRGRIKPLHLKLMLPLYKNRNASVQEYLTKHPLLFYTEIMEKNQIIYDQKQIDNMVEFLSTSHHPHAICVLQKLLREKRQVYEEKYRQGCTWFFFVVVNLNENPYFTDVLFDEFPEWIKIDYLTHNTNSRAVQHIISKMQSKQHVFSTLQDEFSMIQSNQRIFSSLHFLHEFSANTNKEAIAFLRENPPFLSWRIMSTNPADEAIQLLKENEFNINWFALHTNENPTAIEWLENNPIQIRNHLFYRNHSREAYELMYRRMNGNTIKSLEIHMNPFAWKEIQTKLEYSDFKHGIIHKDVFGPLSKNENVHLIFQQEDPEKTEKYIWREINS